MEGQGGGFVCVYCGHIFHAPDELREHVQLFHSTVDNSRDCQLPDTYSHFPSPAVDDKRNFLRHVRDQLQECPHKCPICSVEFSSEFISSEEHMERYHNYVAKKPFPRTYWPETASSPTSADMHVARKHDSRSLDTERDRNREEGEHSRRDGQFSCSQCSATFVWRVQLDHHVERMHPRPSTQRAKQYPSTQQPTNESDDDLHQLELKFGNWPTPSPTSSVCSEVVDVVGSNMAADEPVQPSCPAVWRPWAWEAATAEQSQSESEDGPVQSMLPVRGAICNWNWGLDRRCRRNVERSPIRRPERTAKKSRSEASCRLLGDNNAESSFC